MSSSSRVCARSRRATRSSPTSAAARCWIGLSFGDHDRATAVEQACFHRGLLALGCGDDAIRISPPLVFREDQVQAALEVFEEAVVEVEAAGS